MSEQTIESPFAGFGPTNPLIMSAAGLCKTFNIDQISPVAAAVDIMVIGSITFDERAGNTGTCEYFDNPLYGVNAWGMPNWGSGRGPDDDHGQPSAVYAGWVRKRKVIVSIADFSPLKYSALFYRTRGWGNGIELNFGCPNVRDDGAQHPIVSFDPLRMAGILDLIEAAKRDDGPRTFTGVKLSPYSDPGLLKEVAAVIAESGTVDYVATTNTFPNGRVYTPKLRPGVNTTQAGPNGGISGEALKPISLSNTAQFREALPPTVAVIRVGGISSGQDVWESYDVGCSGVQVMTAIVKHGPTVLTKIREEYAEIVAG